MKSKIEGLTFEPGDSTGTGDQSLEDYQDTTSQNPVNTEPQMAPDVDAQAGQLRSHVEEGTRDPDDDNCPRCASEHITSSMSSPTTSFHECYRCGHGWETREEEYGDRVASVDLSWLNEDTSPGGDDFFAQYERVRGMKEASGRLKEPRCYRGARILGIRRSRSAWIRTLRSVLPGRSIPRVSKESLSANAV
jgi:DNA-directed RNA polymerase subunit M/transcription elongation factor TFIIS